MTLPRAVSWFLKVTLALGIVVAAWIGLLLTTGIAPFPHLANVSPTVLGELTGPAGPLVATPVKVALRDGRTCAEPLAEVSTRGNGMFAFEPIREFHWFLFVMAHRHFEWDLCVKLDGEWLLAKPHEDYTLVDTGPAWAVIIRCRIDPLQGAAPRIRCDETRDLEVPETDVAGWLSTG